MEATLEPRLVMKGEAGKAFVEGEFFVASYQRGYRWGRHEVRQLLDDIRANAKAAEAKRMTPTDYYLQPIVVLRRDDGSWELVDGQQRLTTLFLITRYIKAKTNIDDAAVHYSLTYETREGSRAYLETLDPARREENIDFFHMAAAYAAIDEWFNEAAHGAPLRSAIDLLDALTKWVYVLWYEAPSGTNPNDLFTRLNRDRIELTDSELIKALVLSHGGAAAGGAGRQDEIAAQWDGFERDLRDEDFWAFLTRSAATRSTHIDFLFESMTPGPKFGLRPRHWTFEKVRDVIDDHGAAAFWRDVVARHGLLTGWFRDRHLYHRIGYLVAIGDSLPDLIRAAQSQTHSAFRHVLVDRTRRRLDLTPDAVSLLRYGKGKDDLKCTQLLLLMNVQAVLHGSDPGGRFSFYAYARDGWSLEHIHAQNAQALKTENQRRDWLEAHRKKILATAWSPERGPTVDAVMTHIDAHLALPAGRTDDIGFYEVLNEVFELFGAPGRDTTEEGMHGLGNLALLQREFNSKLNNAVFALKRERILELDQSGAYILPWPRNVFLKYYTAAEDQQLSLWGPQDQDAYYDRLLATVREFLRLGAGAVAGAAV